MISIVSGLPRSGTSLMMQMLAAGGLEAGAPPTRTCGLHVNSLLFNKRRRQGDVCSGVSTHDEKLVPLHKSLPPDLS
jgi:hypothetical protein